MDCKADPAYLPSYSLFLLCALPGVARNSDDDIPRWIASLQSPDFLVRVNATKEISMAFRGDMTRYDELVGPLANTMIIGTTAERIGIPQTLDTLLSLHPKANMTPAVEPLITVLKDPEYRVRMMSSQALGSIGDRAAVTPLLPLLHDPESMVVCTTAVALGKLQDSRAANDLAAQLNYPDSYVQVRISIALGQVGDHRAVPYLINILTAMPAQISNEKAKQSMLPFFKAQALQCLGALGDLRAVEPLLAYWPTTTGNVRTNLIVVLGKLRDPRAIDTLVTELHGSNLGFTLDALRKIGDRRARARLARLPARTGHRSQQLPNPLPRHTNPGSHHRPALRPGSRPLGSVVAGATAITPTRNKDKQPCHHHVLIKPPPPGMSSRPVSQWPKPSRRQFSPRCRFLPR